MRNNYIFSKNNKGELKFVGDFEAVYNENNDPWDNFPDDWEEHA